MKTLFTLFLVSGILLACREPGQKPPATGDQATQPVPDTSLFVIIPYDSGQNSMTNFKNAGPAELSKADLAELERLFVSCLEDYNRNMQKQLEKAAVANPAYKKVPEDYILVASRYKRQYVPVINEKGETEVWVNCFCGEWDERTRKSILMVHDGGNCYFNFKINLSSKTCYDMSVNGVA